MPETMLYVHAVLYDIYNDELFEFPLVLSDLKIEFYNDDFNGADDLKKIKYKGEIDNTVQGSIILGTL